MKKKLLLIACALIVAGAAAGGALYHAYPVQVSTLAGLTRNHFLTLNAPAGTIRVEVNEAAGASTTGTAVRAEDAPAPEETVGDWRGYNKTLTSERFSGLDQINTGNVGGLRVLCTYDTEQIASFESGLVVVNGALIGTTEFDIFSLDPATCAENWRTHEDYPPAILPVNRGVAHLDGRLFRGTQDGRVLAYDFETGERLWATTIADPARGESVPSAPIAWDGLVYVGNAGGDYKGGKGRMYALDAETGEIVWEFFLVPRAADDPVRGPLGESPLTDETWHSLPDIPISGGGTWTSYTLDPDQGLIYVPGGNSSPDFVDEVREGENLYTGSVVVLDAKTGDYRKHYQMVPKDWHDWDVSSTPALIETAGGRRLMSLATKDGHLYTYDLDTDELVYRVPVTTIENAEAPFEVGVPVTFCPGTVGGVEWNGVGYDPRTNLILTGAVDWCFTVTREDDEKLRALPIGQPWMGMQTFDPFDMFGRPNEPDRDWGGWVYAVDADTGDWVWRARSNYPVLSGMTPTAGGLVFFGDVGGNFYALDASTGERLWGEKIGGALGGGVITYSANGKQLVAVTTGFTSLFWPTEITTGKIVVLGLDEASRSQ